MTAPVLTAIDTNVLVRLLTADHVQQAAVARRVFASGPVWIGKTVLLETEWVLRSAYGFDERAIGDAFAALLGLRNVHVEDKVSVTAALALAARGLEFADALHLTSRPAGAAFVTFDRNFVRRAKRAGASAVFSARPIG
jgi:predicted nucleic-acid-binding protein